jgi:uncharacterized membrane protein YbhN (UPF0104 family)
LLTICNSSNNLNTPRMANVAEADSRQTWKTIAKCVIAVIVVVGLVLAARQAIDQWQIESTKLQSEIDALDKQIGQTEDPSKRQELLVMQRQRMDSIPRIRNLDWTRIGIAALIYALALVPPGLLLRRAVIALGLNPLGQNPRLSTAIAAQLLGHAGKYVPGKAMVIVLRAGALAIDGVRPMTTTVAVFVETFIFMAVGAAVAGLVVFWLPVPAWITATAFLFALTASIPTLPPILKRIAAKVSHVDIAQIDSRIGVGLVASGWCLSLISWLLLGASFAILISAIPSPHPIPPPIELYATATAAVSLAMVVGFASLLPGGAGVRELVLATVLGVSLGPAHGLLAAIAHRVLSIIVESIMAGGSWMWLRYTDAKEM